MKKFLFLSVVAVLLGSCTAQKVLSPTEIKLMTTKQYEADYETVFRSAMSLLQSEGFLVNETNKETGLINASKQVDNKNAALTMALLGAAKEASTATVAFFIDPINDENTEVKLTIYEGSVTSSMSNWGQKNTSTKNSMIQKAEVYTNWFNNLRAEIERRKALR
ncbi:MAG TPA: hypothetical protein GXZ87_00930 [Bacteroidales bacterium]|nr:hypothetical protein [Bacteroidales bacterium]